jgi:hypothetical protein
VPAETLVRTAISRLLEQGEQDPRRALEDLRRLRAMQPAADAVEVVRQGRSALGARASRSKLTYVSSSSTLSSR